MGPRTLLLGPSGSYISVHAFLDPRVESSQFMVRDPGVFRG